jgi:predicted DNA-binding transcriptional regulator YafY
MPRGGFDMSQAERISRIHFLLRAKEVVSLLEMKETFEVSRATLMRDIELIRDRLGTPVVYDAGRKGYRLDPHARSGGRVDELPGVWLTAKEGYAFLTMFNVLRAIDPGFLMYFLAPMRRTLKRVLGAMEFTMWRLDEKIVIDLPDFLTTQRNDLSPVFSALVKGDLVQVTWKAIDAQECEAKCRVVRLTLQRFGWLLTIVPAGGQAIDVRLTDIVRCRSVSA